MDRKKDASNKQWLRMTNPMKKIQMQIINTIIYKIQKKYRKV